jgi:hypothetical protein
MLKENGAMYLKQEDTATINNDVSLTSKDMEVNFSNKQEDDDEFDVKGAEYANGGKAEFVKADTMELIDESDLAGNVAGVPDDIKIVEKVKILNEEQKVESKGKQQAK